MKVLFEASFARDLKRIRDKQLKQRIQEAIDEVKEAAEPGEVRSLRKLQGHQTFYRIRLGDYRIGLEIVDAEVVFVRALHRKDIYRYFP
jgi:mRNA interferase RelE/StbE